MSDVRPKIEQGFRVGKLLVTERTDRRKSGYSVWRCSCDCGGTIELDTRTLQRGSVKDCGCETRVRPGMLDLTGQRFGKLICLHPVEEKDSQGNTQWLCRCDCGQTCVAVLHQLRAGYKKSCGCLSHPPLKDYVGKRFGHLTVLSYAGKRDGMHRWKCLCDCGNETVVGQTLLQSGKTRSCGCLVRTPGKDIRENIFYRGFFANTNIGVLEARMKKPPIATNQSGHNGVYRKRSGRWSAQITFKGKTYYLGTYDRIEDAVKARKRGEEMYEEFLDWYYSRYKERMDEEEEPEATAL